MFITDQLTYIQMQKTACTHITSLLSYLYGGTQLRKHSAASDAQISASDYFLSSIRNPWDWYLSLWTYGVQGHGALMKRLTLRQYHKALKLFLLDSKKNKHLLLNTASKDLSLWRSVYGKADNVQLFRQWLKLIHSPQNASLLGEGYGSTGISEFCGFMSYRYLDLCCSGFSIITTQEKIFDYDELVIFEKNNCYIDFFIRQECLEDNFFEAVKRIKPLLREEKEVVLKAKQVNKSQRLLSISDYYDKESIDLIYKRDRLVVDKFGYTPPQIR
jgi:hypothetical protein